MEIRKAGMAGTLESSDCQVTVEPGNGKVDFELQSAVINQFGDQIRKVTYDTLKSLDIKDVKIRIVDKGALDCTLKARIEGAVYRAVNQYDNLPWGGAIKP
jgi:citrate lyase subunit gamma (acyl carrier protein)